MTQQNTAQVSQTGFTTVYKKYKTVKTEKADRAQRRYKTMLITPSFSMKTAVSSVHFYNHHAWLLSLISYTLLDPEHNLKYQWVIRP